MKKIIAVIFLVIAAVGLVYFALNKNSQNDEIKTMPTSAPASAPATHNIIIEGFTFNQRSVSIKKGDTVTWTNKDSAPHTVTGDNGGPLSPTMNTNSTYSFTFNAAGTFNYHCAFHPSMTGIIIVTQ